MRLIYSRLVAGTECDAADRFGVRADFRARHVQCEMTRDLGMDQLHDVWDDFECASPLQVRGPDPSQKNSKAYILQKDPDGSWCVDRWTADGAGAVRIPRDPIPAPAGVQGDPCFIIEISCAGR